MNESILRRARLSGKCPPSLVLNEPEKDNSFEEAVAKVVDNKEFRLRSDPHVALDFLSVMEKSSSIDKVSLPIDTALKNQALQYRRCVVIALVGSTNPGDPSIERILASGYLTSLKSWLTDILASPTGTVDLLLHLLSNIVALPVSKSIIKESGMGKAIGTIDKHSICKGTPNEEAITRRVRAIKDAWQAAVKSQKAKEDALQKNAKRSAEKVSSPMSVKRAKPDEPKKMSSFSSLVKRMSDSNKASPGDKLATALEKANAEANQKPVEKKKTNKRVKWVDHFGGEIRATQFFADDGDDVEKPTEQSEKPGSWSDRKKRDRMRERELLATAKKAKILDDEDDGAVMSRTMATTASWKSPLPLPERADVSKPVVDSPETLVQEERIKTVAKAVYLADHLVPPNPTPLSDIEQALDMTSQAAANVTTIPFFAPKEQAVPADTTTYDDAAMQQQTIPSMSTLPPAPESAATPEFAQSLGLPPYLAGHPVKTLQTLAGSPGLLGTLVGANGLYDQTKLMTLVHTLSANIAPPPAAPYQPPVPAYNAPNPISYNSGRGPGGGNYQHKKSDEGNLHVAGYGSMTTEAELIAAFSPYVKVDEVVMKSNFSFVNTSDPINAQRARDALTGTLVGGMPIRINAATRKKNNDHSLSAYGSGGGSMSQYQTPSAPPSAPSMGMGSPPPPNNPPVVSVDNVRDDRGNPATKNLFVAGYGPNTTEQELREMFSMHATVTGVVNKGTFSFVNTMDRAAAVNARQCLGGTMVNGGVLRINFAKETGRLGTSFDLTYNTNTGPHARNNAPRAGGNGGLSYYGRGF